MRGIDVELSPDADSPRPCGLALLLCMLERGDKEVGMALLGLAQQLQVNSSTSHVPQQRGQAGVLQQRLGISQACLLLFADSFTCQSLSRD